MRNLYSTAICILLLLGCGDTGRFASPEMKKEIWCALNSNRTPVGSVGPHVEIQSNDVHVVPQKYQIAMQGLLKKERFLEISREMAEFFVPSIDKQKETNLYYLVRAAGPYDEELESSENLKFHAFYFLETETLNVYFFGLATQLLPKNVAILIGMEHRISKANSLCEIAV